MSSPNVVFDEAFFGHLKEVYAEEGPPSTFGEYARRAHTAHIAARRAMLEAHPTAKNYSCGWCPLEEDGEWVMEWYGRCNDMHLRCNIEAENLILAKHDR